MEQITSQNSVSQAFRDTLPCFSFLPIGFVLGYLMTQMGYAWFYAPLMSLVVYGGSVQFLALGLVASGAGMVSIGIAALLLSLRNFFYGLIFLDRFKGPVWQRLYMIHGMVDSVFALILNRPSGDMRYCLFVNFFTQIWWVGSALLGSLIVLPEIPHLEFVLTALFTTMTVDQMRKSKTKSPFIVATVAAVIALLIFPTQMLLVSILLSATTLIIIGRKTACYQ